MSMDSLNHVGDEKETKITLHKLCSNICPTYDASMLQLVLDLLIDLSIYRGCKKSIVWIMEIESNRFIQIEEYLLKREKGAATTIVRIGVCITLFVKRENIYRSSSDCCKSLSLYT